MNGAGKEEEQDGMSVHSPCKAPPSSASSLPKSQVELELRLLEALEIYPPIKLRGIHRHFVLYGLMEFLRRSFDRHFSPDEVLQLLDRFYNLEMLVCNYTKSCVIVVACRLVVVVNHGDTTIITNEVGSI
ncbi:uncharacterized protein LOC131145070 isoform X1 [Malania oleifera]|uniref:uncharacterized protein LOC131145070 isoform X1 n=1 Tax=Malania oleifera TaxID=397392 RepID=UPI0025AE5D40|nr:uncharacterized protein LOC131145070 isoform X1 [Malania oleifera]